MAAIIDRSGFVIIDLRDSQISYGVFDSEKAAIEAAKRLADPEKYLVAKLVPTMLFEKCNVIEKRIA
jgi:hypothetical protein